MMEWTQPRAGPLLITAPLKCKLPSMDQERLASGGRFHAKQATICYAFISVGLSKAAFLAKWIGSNALSVFQPEARLYNGSIQKTVRWLPDRIGAGWTRCNSSLPPRRSPLTHSQAKRWIRAWG